MVGDQVGEKVGDEKKPLRKEIKNKRR